MTDIAIGLAAKAAAGLSKLAPYLIAAALIFGLGWVWAWKAPWIGAHATIDRLADDRSAWQAAQQVDHAAFVQERQSFAVVLKAIDTQDAAVISLGRASAGRLQASASAATVARSDFTRAQQASAQVLASAQGSTACDRAQAVDDAFLKVLQ